MDWYVKSKRAQTVNDDETWVEGGVSPTLNAFDQGDTRATVLAVSSSSVQSVTSTLTTGKGQRYDPDTESLVVTGDVIGTLQSQPRGVPSTDEIAGGQAVITGSNVRRLTPIECERLQGFPDEWTAGLADSHRYKQMGNAVTVNVAHYIGTLLPDA